MVAAVHRWHTAWRANLPRLVAKRRVRPGSTYSGAGGMVYVAEMNGLFKIGWSNSPVQRIRGIQASLPYRVTLVGTIEGSQSDERLWHKLFEAKRVGGEWFRLDPADLVAILGADDMDQTDPRADD